MTTATNPLVLVEQQGAVAVVQLNRPDALNALSPEMMAQLMSALEQAESDEATRAVIIAGHDRCFVAGADIKSMQTRPLSDVMRSHTARFWMRLATIEVPLIAAVSGAAYGGGCELALACDLVVASETAKFAQAEIKLGIIPGGGGTQRLARTIGKQRTMEVVLLGDAMTATEAKQLGLVNRVTSPDRWRDEAMDLAQRVAAGPPLAIRLAKKAVLGAFDTGFTAGMTLERRLFELAYGSEDRVEGMTSFIDGRPANWQGR